MSRTQQTPLLDDQIEELLNQSEVEDFIPSDEDVGDPGFREYYNSDDSSDLSSDTEGDTQDAEPVSRGRGRGRGRGRPRFARSSIARLSRSRGMRRGGRARGQEANHDRYSPSTSATVSASNEEVFKK